MENDIFLCKCWAAISGTNAVALVSMSVPSTVDFEQYRKKALEFLGVAGEVRAGELVQRGSSRYFIRRNTHANRGKTPRPNKEYLITYEKNIR